MSRGDIGAVKAYLGECADQVFCAQSKVADALRPNPALVRGFQNAKNGELPTLTIDGLGDYSKSAGYVSGVTTLEWTEYSLSKDRGRQIVLDNLNIMQEQGMLDASYVLSEMVRTKIVPEIDANAIASICQKIIANQGTVTSHKGTRIEYSYTPVVGTFLTKLITMLNAVKARTGEEEGYHIFVNADYRGILETSTEVTKTKNINGGLSSVDARTLLLNGEPIVFVPASRMYSKIDCYDGSSSGEEAGGYIKDATAGKDVVAVVVKDGSAQAITAHNVTKIIEDSEKYDGTLLNVRVYYDTLLPTNKMDGVEVLIKDSESS